MAVGDVIITWDWADKQEAINFNATTTSATVGIQSIEGGMSKNVMSIPVPNQNNIGFDIGFCDADDMTITAILTDGATIGSCYNKLKKAIKYKKHINTTTGKSGDSFKNVNDPFLISWEHDDWTEIQYGLISSFNYSFEGGGGSLVNIRLGIKIVNKPNETNPYEG